MSTEAERIVARATRQAFAEGMAYFAKHFGHTAAATFCGVVVGLCIAWVLWLFWFAAVETWTILVSPLVIAGAEFVFFAALMWAWRLIKGKG